MIVRLRQSHLSLKNLRSNIKLTEDNYKLLARNFLNAMKGKRKEFFIDETMECPMKDPQNCLADNE